MLTVKQLPNREDYPRLMSHLSTLSPTDKRWHMRELARYDLYFLIRYICNRPDMDHPWLFARCREVQEFSDGHLDLWARDHYKSTIITFGKTIQDILQTHGANPIVEDCEVTVGIFSHTRPIAKAFLRQIMREFEGNNVLKELFPDILWINPRREAPKWSEDDGIVMRRTSNPKESTIEAWGLVDGQPTSKHFKLRVYDDVVTIDSVRSPEMQVKTMESLELSYNLGSEGGVERFVGTRYHANDAYKTILDRGTVIPRIYPATANGMNDGEPVLLSEESLALKRTKLGPYTYSCQLLLNPFDETRQGFNKSWMRFYSMTQSGAGMNKVILVDPASKKKKKSDYTAIWVVGLGKDDNYYVLDFLRDRLGLTERGDAIFAFHQKWKPGVVKYEEYGLQADIEYIRDRQERENYRFNIVPVGGQLGKTDRILRLVPLFEQGKLWFPKVLNYRNKEGVTRNLIDIFVEEELVTFPVPSHDDMLDALSRLVDAPLLTVPNEEVSVYLEPETGCWL